MKTKTQKIVMGSLFAALCCVATMIIKLPSPLKCIFEKPTVKGFCDIFVPTIGDQALAIEVKTGKEALKVKDIAQAYKYARDKRQRFALLTNGYESYVVFWFTNNFKYITVKNRKIELPPIIQEYLIKLNNEKRKKKLGRHFYFKCYTKKDINQ